MRENALSNEYRSEENLPDLSIRQELFRILASPIFAQSERLGRFLRFTVEKTLAGDAGTLKEYLIGTEVYDRKPPYRPNLDSIVRSEARRLRIKLREYYQLFGKNDPVWIYYQPGSYVPRFQAHNSRAGDSTLSTTALGELVTEELVRHALKDPSGAQAFDVQIVFEGTVRVSRRASPTEKPIPEAPSHSGQKQDRVRKVFSMPPRNVRQS